MLLAADSQALLLSIKLGAVTTFLLISFCLPLAGWLSYAPSRLKMILTGFTTLPLVFPPSVIGFYLLLAFSPQSIFSRVLKYIGIDSLPFSFSGLVVASCIYSLPFVLQPLQAAFTQIGYRPYEVAATLGVSPWRCWWYGVLPQSRAAILGAAVIGFAHTLGEFGIVLMIGGNIPGKTQLISLQIYNHVEALEYSQANLLAMILAILTIPALAISFWLQYRFNRRLHYL